LRALVPAWNVIAIEAACAVWAIHRRALPAHALGRGIQPLAAQIRPLLPIGSEGVEIFDLAPIVDLLRNGI